MRPFCAYGLGVFRLAWLAAREASFGAGSVVRNGLLVVFVLVGTWWLSGLAAVSAEAVRVLLVAGSIVLLFVLTFIYQLIRAPYTLYREQIERVASLVKRIGDLEADLHDVKTPKIEVFWVGVHDAVERGDGSSPADTWPAKYVKVGVRPIGPTISEARCYLTGVRRKTPAGIEEAAPAGSFRLLWSMTDRQDTVALESGVPRHFDVVFCSSRNPQLSLCRGVGWPLIWKGFFSRPAQYQFDLSVTGGKTATKHLTIEVDWNGHWQNVAARLVEHA